MDIYFAGGESPSHRKRLAEAGVEKVAVNYTHLRARLPKTKSWDLDDVFPNEVRILLYCRVTSTDPAERAEIVDEYVAFARSQISRIELLVEADTPDAAALRQERWGWVPPEMFVPVWTASQNAAELCRSSDWLAVPESVEGPAKVRLLMAVRQHRTQLLALNSSSADAVQSGLYSAVLSSSWLSAMRYGETMIWDGGRMRRYSTRQKEQARRRHYGVLMRTGIDIDKLLKEDDKNAATQLALWSWRQLEASVVKRRIPRSDESINYPPESADEPKAEIEERGVDNRLERSGTPTARERIPLPLLNLTQETVEHTDEAGVTTTSKSQRMGIQSASLRQCDTCVLSASCPAFEPGHACAYEFPIELRTKDQFMDMMNALLKIQGDRVLFARMAEELQGGYPDPTLSAEMDRFFGMVEKLKEISDTRDFVKIQAEVRSSAGTLSRLFGPGAGQAARELPNGGLNASETDDLVRRMAGADVVEAHIIE